MATVTEPPALDAPAGELKSKFLEALSVLTTPIDIIKHRPQWPNPEQSIDREYRSLSRWNQRCWSATGPAREQLVPVCREIASKLNHDELVKGVNTTDWSIAVNLYMVGRNERKARPVIIVVCRNSIVRKNAMKMIRDMDVLKEYEGVKLGERAFSPSPVAGEGMAEIQQSDITNASVMGEAAIVCYTRHLVSNPCGASIFFKISEFGVRDATMGGVVVVDGHYYGMTASHASAVFPASYSNASTETENILLRIEDDDDSSTADPSVSQAPGPVAVGLAGDESGTAWEESGTAWDFRLSRINIGRRGTSELVELGTKMGPAWRDDELDWELFKITNISYKTSNALPIPYRDLSLKWAPVTEPPDADVLVMTGTTGILLGRLSGTPFFLRMPGRKRFQEVWVVYMERELKFGDCGSWVIDSSSGIIYGHVVAADVYVAYIVPAHQVSAGIEAALGFGPSLPEDDTPLSPDAEIQTPTSAGNAPDATEIRPSSQDRQRAPQLSTLNPRPKPTPLDRVRDPSNTIIPTAVGTLRIEPSTTSGIRHTPMSDVATPPPVVPENPTRFMGLLQTAMNLVKNPFGPVGGERRTVSREGSSAFTVSTFVKKVGRAATAKANELPRFLTGKTSDRNDNATEDHDQDEDTYAEGARDYARIFVLCFVSFFVGIDQRMIVIATPKITNDFRSLGDLGWYGSAYFLSVAVGHFCFRKIYYLWPPQIGFFFASLLFALGGVLCLWRGHTIVLFVLGRAVIGLGAAGLLGGIPAITVAMFPRRMRPLCLQSTHGAFCLGFVGSLIGGALADKDWKICFYLDIAAGSFAVIASFLFSGHSNRINNAFRLRRQKERKARSILLVLMLTGCPVCLSLALQWGGSKYPWRDVRIVILFVAFAVCLVAYLGYIQPYLRHIQKSSRRFSRNRTEISDTSFHIEEPARSESIPLRIKTLPSILLDLATRPAVVRMRLDAPISAYLVLAASRGAYVQVINTYMPIWFQSVKTTTAIKSSIYTLPFVLISAYTSAYASAFFGRSGLHSRRGWLWPLFRLISAVPAIIGSFLMTTLRFPSSKGKFIGYQILGVYYAGLGTLEPSTILELYPYGDAFFMIYTGVAFAEAMGSAIGIAAAQSVFLNSLVDKGRGIPAATIFNSTSEVPVGFPGLYDASLSRTYYISGGTAGVALLLTTLIWMTALWRRRRTELKAERADAAADRPRSHSSGQEVRETGFSELHPIPLGSFLTDRLSVPPPSNMLAHQGQLRQAQLTRLTNQLRNSRKTTRENEIT